MSLIGVTCKHIKVNKEHHSCRRAGKSEIHNKERSGGRTKTWFLGQITFTNVIVVKQHYGMILKYYIIF